jgi:hypothetical protein
VAQAWSERELALRSVKSRFGIAESLVM